MELALYDAPERSLCAIYRAHKPAIHRIGPVRCSSERDKKGILGCVAAWVAVTLERREGRHTAVTPQERCDESIGFFNTIGHYFWQSLYILSTDAAERRGFDHQKNFPPRL